MNALLDKILRWTLPPTPIIVFRAGHISRGLARFKSVGCSIRNSGQCPYELELYGCADCTLTGRAQTHAMRPIVDPRAR